MGSVRQLAVVLAALALAGCGREEHGALSWSGEATVFTHPTLPGDRVLTGTLRNDGLRRMRLQVRDVRVLAADGSAVPATPVFLQTFGKSLWSPGRGPEQMPDSELLRTGRIAFLRPGEEVPITVAWRAAEGAPVRLDYREGSLPVPDARR